LFGSSPSTASGDLLMVDTVIAYFFWLVLAVAGLKFMADVINPK
jgi:hypothetical protein